MNRIIFHIDVNSAFLSWTSVENIKNGTGPDLRLIPAIIGGDQSQRHGVVLAKSISAKSFGVRTGEPIVHALKKCPSLIMAPPCHKLYKKYSTELMNYLHELTPDIEQVSIDECYLDFTGISQQYSSPTEAAKEIKNEISKRFGFTVNIGISSNKLLAKMASDFQKPDKIHTLFPHEIQKKMWPLPLEELYMAGKSSVETLHKLGIRTIGELACTDPTLITPHLKSHGLTLWEFANGIADSQVNSKPPEAKGIGNSTTLSKDVETADEAKAVLLKLAESVSRRLRKAEVISGNICVEIKYNTFVSTSHQMPADPPLSTSEGIYQIACHLFDNLWNQTPIRLLGIRATKLMPEDTPIQLTIFDMEKPKNEKQRKLENAMDTIKKRYGENAVMRGSFLNTQKKPPEH